MVDGSGLQACSRQQLALSQGHQVLIKGHLAAGKHTAGHYSSSAPVMVKREPKLPKTSNAALTQAAANQKGYKREVQQKWLRKEPVAIQLDCLLQS